MKPDFKGLNDILLGSERIVITTHLIPDGDAIGSVLSLYHFLKHYGKDPVIINHSPTPENLSFLDRYKVIKVFPDAPEANGFLIDEADLICILDTNEYSRTRSMEQAIRDSNAKKICIDHHQGINEADYELTVCDISYPATCQLLYDFMSSVDQKVIDKNIAEPMYAGILTDTGSFRYPRTTATTFSICADLIERGADPVNIYEHIYSTNTVNKVKLMARYVENLDFYYDKKLGAGIVTEKDFKDFDADVTDIEGFSSIIMSIKGIEMGILLFELPKSIKVSFRSKGEIKANELAKEFGGGGHKNAAGASLEKQDILKLREIVIAAAEKYLV